MKISRNTSNIGGQRRRRNPLVLPVVVLILLLALLIGWFWSRGGAERAQQRVEKVIPAERLGH
jgi:hypothetical protein